MSVNARLSSVNPPRDPVIPGVAVDDTPTRQARCLLGWVNPEVALQMLMSQPGGCSAADAERSIEAAHSVVQSRMVDGIDQSAALSELPPTLNSYIDQLRTTSGMAANMIAQGWSVGMVDLRHLCAFQPLVMIDGVERVSGTDQNDEVAIARLTLPTEGSAAMRWSFDERSRTWVVSSPSPNLHVVAPLSPTPELPAFGYVVGVTPSYVQVIRSHGRLLLHDGYHRCAGLVKLGVFRVPALIWDNQLVDQLVPAGMLPPDTYLGPSPPGLADYFDSAVSCTVVVPAIERRVIVPAIEIGA